MSMVSGSGDHLVQLNSIDLIFAGKKGGDSVEINQGIMKAYGDDNDVTYLVSHVKLPKGDKEPKAITVDRDVDGHLTWKIGDKEVHLGSSWWVRVKHAIMSFFSKDYRIKHEIDVTRKIDRIRNAYAECLDKEYQAEEAAAEALRQQQADIDDAALLAQQQQEAEDAALLLQQQEAAKQERIEDLKTNISTQEASLEGLKADLGILNTTVSDYETKLGEIVDRQIELATKKNKTLTMIDDYNSWIVSEISKRALQELYPALNGLSTEEVLTGLNAAAKDIDDESNLLDQESATRNTMIAEIRDNQIPAKNTEITNKQNEIAQLKTDLLAEES